MIKTYCGMDCEECQLKETCKGCMPSGGKPFEKECQIAKCCLEKKQDACEACGVCALREKLISEIKALGIPALENLSELFELNGSTVNLEYTLPSGQTVKILDDDRIYLGNQIEKPGSDRCYGIAADGELILICEYGCGGSFPEIVVLKRRKGDAI